jgi:hypothetical protein
MYINLPGFFQPFLASALDPKDCYLERFKEKNACPMKLKPT